MHNIWQMKRSHEHVTSDRGCDLACKAAAATDEERRTPDEEGRAASAEVSRRSARRARARRPTALKVAAAEHEAARRSERRECESVVAHEKRSNDGRVGGMGVFAAAAALVIAFDEQFG